MPPTLRDRWMATMSRFEAGRLSTAAVYDSIAVRYQEPHRRYHTLEHVAAVLDTIEELAAAEPAEVPTAVRLGGWLHDVVYDPTRSDNEARSATHARLVLSTVRVPVSIIEETARLIELTAGHEVEADDRNAMVLVDADLAILGAPPEVYDRYATAIRAEYAHVPDDDYRAGRRRILETFLGRPRLFRTDLAHERFDAPARANLTREITQLH